MAGRWALEFLEFNLGSIHPGSPTQDHKPSEHAPPAAPLITPPQVDSPQSLSQAAEAQTGAPDRLACILTAPPGAHSSSSASVHPSVRPRELASPAPPPAQGDGGFQHAPVLMESTMALTESVGALITNVPLPWQHEDRGHQAAVSLPPVPGSCSVLGDSPPFGGCSWAGSSHAPVGHPASLVTPGSPDPGSNARSKLSPSSS